MGSGGETILTAEVCANAQDECTRGGTVAVVEQAAEVDVVIEDVNGRDNLAALAARPAMTVSYTMCQLLPARLAT